MSFRFLLGNIFVSKALWKGFAAVSILSFSMNACAPKTNKPSEIKEVDVEEAVVDGLIDDSQTKQGSSHTVVADGFLRYIVEAEMDAEDLKAMRENQQNALEYAKTNQKVEWSNPHTGNYGDFMPKKTYVENGRNCREYAQTLIIGEKTESTLGKACRRDDGFWEILK